MTTTQTPIHLISETTALLLIELQDEWVSADGALNPMMRDRAQFQRALRGAARALSFARSNGLRVIHSGLHFAPGHPELGRARAGLRAAIPHAGTFAGEACAFAAGFEPEPGELVVAGRLGASAFAGSNLDAILRYNGIDTVVMAGFALHVCVESTLRHAHDLGYNGLVLEDATAAFKKAQGEHVLEHVVHHFGRRASTDRLRLRPARIGVSDAA